VYFYEDLWSKLIPSFSPPHIIPIIIPPGTMKNGNDGEVPQKEPPASFQNLLVIVPSRCRKQSFEKTRVVVKGGFWTIIYFLTPP